MSIFAQNPKTMRKLFFCLFTLLISNLIFSNELFELKLNKGEKLAGTYSVEFSGNKTIHIVILKKSDSQGYTYKPVYVDENKKVIEFNSFVSVAKQEFLSHHLKNNVLTLVNYDDDQKLINVLDFDVTSGTLKRINLPSETRPNNIFRLDDRSTLVYLDKKKGLVAKEIFTTEGINEKVITFDKEQNKEFKEIINSNPEAVNQNEYVKNGSIAKSKCYLIDGNYYVSIEQLDKTIAVTKFDFTAKSFKSNSVKPKYSSSLLKDYGNYLYNDKLVTVSVLKEDAVLTSYDAENLKESSVISVLKTKYNDKLADFIKLASKGAMKSTITINKNKTGNLVVRLDNVSESTYQYNYNWWFNHWMFQQQVMFQQQMMMQRNMNFGGGFGPSPVLNEECLYFYEEKKNEAIEFVLDSDFKNIVDEVIDTELKFTDRNKYLDKFKEDKEKKEFTSAFINDEYRYIYLNKSNQTIKIGYDKM